MRSDPLLPRTPSCDVPTGSLWPSELLDITGRHLDGTQPSWLDPLTSSALTANPLWFSGPADIAANVGSTLPSWLDPLTSSALTAKPLLASMLADIVSKTGSPT